MNELKKISMPLILVILAGAFLLVCLMVYLSRGKSAKWIARKMKLGAVIITITTLSTGCPTAPVITCYDPMPTNWFSFDSIDQTDYSVLADLPADSVLTGKVYQPDYEKYTFKIQNADSQWVDKGTVVPVDGDFNTSQEDFKMTISPEIQTGNYRLVIFSTHDDRDGNEIEVFQTKLRVK